MKILKYLALLPALCAPLAFVACDEVKEGDRYIEMDNVVPKRHVLIEEFTGQMCTNCPEGHRDIAQLKQQYGDWVVPVCIHASNQAIAAEYGGLMIPDGSEIFKASGCTAIPAAIIDGVSGVIGRAEWPAVVRRQIVREPVAEIAVNASAADKAISVAVDVTSTIDAQGSLSVWVVENNVVGYQLDNGENILDYNHQHVLRACVTGASGEPISISSSAQLSKSYTIPVAADWNVANIQIVAFVRTSALGVLNVGTCNL